MSAAVAGTSGLGGGGGTGTRRVDITETPGARQAAVGYVALCSIITFVTLIIINSLAWAGVMGGTATAITNISLITLGTIPKLCLAATMGKEDESYTRKCIVIAALFILAMNVLVNTFTITGHIPGEVLGQAMVGMCAYQIIECLINSAAGAV